MKPEIFNRMKKRTNIVFYALNPKILYNQLVLKKYPKNNGLKCERRYTLFENKHLIRKLLFTAQLKK